MFSRFLQNGFGVGIALGQSRAELFSLAPSVAGSQLPQQAPRFPLGQPPDFPIDSPSGAALLDNSPAPIKAHVTDFDFAWDGPVINSPVDGQASSDATAQSNVKNWIGPLPSPVQRLSQRGGIGIIIDPDWSQSQLVEPLTQFEL